MQRFLSKYGVAAHLAILAVSPLFLFPYCGSGWIAAVVFWLSLFAGVWVFLEPSRRSGEMLHDARVRVARSVAADPLFWAALVIVLLSAVRWANGGIGLGYDIERGSWSIRPARLSFIPGSVDGAGALPCAVSVALLVMLAGCRHSLGRAARMSFLLSASVLSGVAATAAVLAQFFGHEAAVSASKCGLWGGSFAGTGFGLFFLAALASMAGIFDMGWNRHLFLAAFSAGLCAAGLYFFAPTPVILAYLAAGAVVLVATAGYLAVRNGPNAAFKCLAVTLIASLVPVLAVLALADDQLNDARLAFIAGEEPLFDAGFSEAKSALSRISGAVFAVHPWIGTGIGSFPLGIRFNAQPADWSVIGIGRTDPFSAWWLVAAERGIAEILLFALVGGLLAFTFARRLYDAARHRVLSGTFLPGVVLAVSAAAALAAESFIDTSALRPECLMAAGSFLAVAALCIPSAGDARGK